MLLTPAINTRSDNSDQYLCDPGTRLRTEAEHAEGIPPHVMWGTTTPNPVLR